MPVVKPVFQSQAIHWNWDIQEVLNTTSCICVFTCKNIHHHLKPEELIHKNMSLLCILYVSHLNIFLNAKMFFNYFKYTL